MGFQKYKELEFVYEYDFAVDGGAVSTIALRQIGNPMAAGLTIESAAIYVTTDLVGATAVVTIGNSADDDGYFADIMTASVLDTVINVGNVAGALLWDNTNDNELVYVIPSAAASIPKIKIATAALTAGKLKLVFKCRQY